MTDKASHSAPARPGTALVTGAADRIGAAIARALAAEGWAVVIHHRGGAEKAEALAKSLPRAATARADLANRAERAGLVAEAAKPFGPLTLLVNNASAFERDSIHDLDEALWDRHFAVHVEAPAFLSRDFASQLPEGEPGNIINMVDSRVLNAPPSYFSYTLSKRALFDMTRTLAQSLAPQIRVNAIGPGPAEPPPGVSAEAHAKKLAALPLKDSADAEALAEGVLAILRLPSMTGQMLALDGGEHLEWPERRGITPKRP